MATAIDFKWPADPATDFFRLYEDGDVVADNIVEPYFSLLMVDIAEGEHSYEVEAINQFSNKKSAPVIINFQVVALPVLTYTVV